MKRNDTVWTMVICPVCEKVGYDDERHKIGSQYPCASCVEEFIFLKGL